MTGAGSHAVDADIGRVEAEARAVNHRFLKTSLRVHGALPRMDAAIEKLVRRHAHRGHVSVHVRVRRKSVDPTSRIDEDALREAAARLQALAQTAGLPAPTLQDILPLPGVTRDEREDAEDEALLAVAQDAVAGALKDMVASREREGRRLAEEMEQLLASVATCVEEIDAHADEVPKAAKAKLEARLAELLEGSGVTPDPEQIARTCATLADRSDVREEIARLQAHIQHAHELLATERPAGKALDFLIQEFHREATTIGSKASDLALGRAAMALKRDVERLREQVQNVE